MSITQTQQITSTGSPLVLNGVVAGALLTMMETGFNSGVPTTGFAVPTDTQRTWTNAIAPSAIDNGSGSAKVASAVAYQANAASGTHSVSVDSAFTSRHCTLVEWAGADQNPVDKSNSNAISGDHTSNAVGSTGILLQGDELVIAVCSLIAQTGSATVGWTDPVSGYTTQQKFNDDATDVAGIHVYKLVSAATAESPTFNWTAHEVVMASAAVIATFRALVNIPQDLTPTVLLLLSQGGIPNTALRDVRAWF